MVEERIIFSRCSRIFEDDAAIFLRIEKRVGEALSAISSSERMEEVILLSRYLLGTRALKRISRQVSIEADLERHSVTERIT